MEKKMNEIANKEAPAPAAPTEMDKDVFALRFMANTNFRGIEDVLDQFQQRYTNTQRALQEATARATTAEARAQDLGGRLMTAETEVAVLKEKLAKARRG